MLQRLLLQLDEPPPLDLQVAGFSDEKNWRPQPHQCSGQHLWSVAMRPGYQTLWNSRSAICHGGAKDPHPWEMWWERRGLVSKIRAKAQGL